MHSSFYKKKSKTFKTEMRRNNEESGKDKFFDRSQEIFLYYNIIEVHGMKVKKKCYCRKTYQKLE